MLGGAARSPREAQQPQRSPQLAVKPTEAAQQAAPASTQHIAAEAALQSPACRAASCNTGCHPGDPQLGEAELPVPAKLTDACEAAQAVMPAAREQALSAARDTSQAVHEVTSGRVTSAVREQALSAARDASRAAQLQVPGGATTAAEQQLNLDVARFNAAMRKARAHSHAASDEAPAAVGQALNGPHEDDAETLTSAELAGSQLRQATLPGTSSSLLASGDLSGSQATRATRRRCTGRDGTACQHLGAQPCSCTSDATLQAAHQRRRLLDLPRRVYNVKDQKAKEQVRQSQQGQVSGWRSQGETAPEPAGKRPGSHPSPPCLHTGRLSGRENSCEWLRPASTLLQSTWLHTCSGLSWLPAEE